MCTRHWNEQKVKILCPLFEIKMFYLVLGALDIKNDIINILSNTPVNTSKIFYIEIWYEKHSH